MFVRFAWFLWGAIIAGLILFPVVSKGAEFQVPPGPMMAVDIQSKSYVISAFDAPCTVSNALATVPPGYADRALAAEGMYEGKRYEVCVVPLLELGFIAIHWDDGTYIPLAVQAWQPANRNQLPKPEPDA